MKPHCLVVTAVFLFSAGVAMAGGDATAGAVVFKKCAACHTATEPVNKVGPSLVGVVGRPVAMFPGYSYSEGMTAFAEGGRIWDEATLIKYLPAPKFLVKGTKMTFAGLRKPEDIVNLIAYLKDPSAAN